jgi:hypothetical protein
MPPEVKDANAVAAERRELEPKNIEEMRKVENPQFRRHRNQEKLKQLQALQKLQDGHPAPDGSWIQIPKMVKVLVEMPEDDALWLRTLLQEKGANIEVVDETNKIDGTREIEMHIREILIQP